MKSSAHTTPAAWQRERYIAASRACSRDEAAREESDVDARRHILIGAAVHEECAQAGVALRPRRLRAAQHAARLLLSDRAHVAEACGQLIVGEVGGEEVVGAAAPKERGVAGGIDRHEAIVELRQEARAFAAAHQLLRLRQQLLAAGRVLLERPRLAVRHGRLQHARNHLLPDARGRSAHQLDNVLAAGRVADERDRRYLARALEVAAQLRDLVGVSLERAAAVPRVRGREERLDECPPFAVTEGAKRLDVAAREQPICQATEVDDKAAVSVRRRAFERLQIAG
eukprot:2664352-Prymnesium_polylepis.1